MIQCQCQNCIFWQTLDGTVGSCHRATGTTAESSCSSGMPTHILDKIAEKIVPIVLEKLKPAKKEEPADAVQEKPKGKRKAKTQEG